MEIATMKTVSEWIVENFKFEWIVKNFSFINGQKGTSITSLEYQIDIAGDYTKWMISLYPFGDEVENNVEVCLGLSDTKLDDLMVLCEFVLFNIQGKQIVKRTFSKPEHYTKGQSFGFPSFIKRDDLLRNISDNDYLTIVANIKVSNCIENFYCSSISKVHSSIIDDLDKLRLDTDLSDILITVCGSEFRAHKNILGARSTVFSSMFKHNMKEANSGKIEIEDMTPEVFEEFLKFIYTGIANVEEHASELFTAADKYDVQDLKAFCENALIKKINEENCIKTLILSDLHSSTKLKEIAMNFIVSNTRKTDKNKLAELKNPSLMLELIEAFVNHKK